MTSMIEKRESLQEIALRHLDDGVFVFDKDRKIVLFNPACERIVGYSQAEISENESNCFDIFRCHSSGKSCLTVCPGLDLFKERRSRLHANTLSRPKRVKRNG